MKKTTTYLILAGVGALGVFLFTRGSKAMSVIGPMKEPDIPQIISTYKAKWGATEMATHKQPEITPVVDNDILNIPIDIRELYTSVSSMGEIFKPSAVKYDPNTLIMEGR